MSAKVERLLITGGGTGGHIHIGIAIAREFLSRGPDHEILFVGTRRGLDSVLVGAGGFPLEFIEVDALKSIGWARRFRSLLSLPGSVLQSRRILRRFRPGAVVGVGGYSAGPPALVASWMGIPLVLVEPNSVPGFTNSVLRWWADRVAVQFQSAAAVFGSKAVRTGIPVRPEFVSLPERRPAGRFAVLVFGGSQGSHVINAAVTDALPYWKQWGLDLQIRHQTGQRELEMVQQRYRQAGVDARVEPFIDDMAAAFAQADLLVCRAGASSLAEIAAARKAAVLIPFAGASDDHQKKNALELVDQGAAVMLEEKVLSGETLAEQVRSLAQSPQTVARIGQAAGRHARPDASARIVDLIEALGEKP
ncbi:MAG: undecaprenyldiphospho-muramoylpentapeptide beta-N-acetylglucosaminyltransferase [Acidobacteriota bacterium]